MAQDILREEGDKMANITQEVNIDILEKLPDGNFKIKYPKTTKEQVGLGNVLNYGIATQAEAKAGTSNTKYMTPLRVKNAIDGLGTKALEGTFTQGNPSTINLGFAPKLVIVAARDGGSKTHGGIIFKDGSIWFTDSHNTKYSNKSYITTGGFVSAAYSTVDYSGIEKGLSCRYIAIG